MGDKMKTQKSIPNSIESQVTELESLRTRIKNLKEQEEQLKELIYENYRQKLELSYKEKDEPFGVVNFQEEGFKISFTTLKKVEWNQDGLKKLYNEGAPVEVEYNVKESVFKAQDAEGKDAFMAYRTVKPGTVTIKVEYDN
jgi:hypothetical protein